MKPPPRNPPIYAPPPLRPQSSVRVRERSSPEDDVAVLQRHREEVSSAARRARSLAVPEDESVSLLRRDRHLYQLLGAVAAMGQHLQRQLHVAGALEAHPA